MSKRHKLTEIDGLTLYQYQRLPNQKYHNSVLIVFALVNTPKILDLSQECSFIKGLLKNGIDVYLIDWGWPDKTHKNRTLQNYIVDYLSFFVEKVVDKTSQKKVNLLGVCQGGYFSLCYTAIFPEKVDKLITMVTPVDFNVSGNRLFQLGRFVNIDALVDKYGNIPGSLIVKFLANIAPFQTPYKKATLWAKLQKDNSYDKKGFFLKLEDWANSCPDQAGDAFREFAKNCVQQNLLIKGDLKLNLKKNILLKNIKNPILNIFANKDHLCPVECVTALKDYHGSDDYTQLAFDGGHIGVFASRRSQEVVVPVISKWL